MTCEDTQPARVTWEVQQLEPFSRVWICRFYGRATTTAPPTDLARAALTAHLATQHARPGETFRAVSHTDADGPHVVTTDQLADHWTASPDVRQALPIYLRDALTQEAATT